MERGIATRECTSAVHRHSPIEIAHTSFVCVSVKSRTRHAEPLPRVDGRARYSLFPEEIETSSTAPEIWPHHRAKTVKLISFPPIRSEPPRSILGPFRHLGVTVDQFDKRPKQRQLLEPVAIGQTIGKALGLVGAPVRKTVSLRSSAITMTHVQVGQPLRQLTPPLPCEKAVLLSLWLSPVTNHEQWKWGKLTNADDYPRGSMNVVHLEEEIQGLFAHPFESVQIHLPELALRELSGDDQVPEFGELARKSWHKDLVMESLAGALLAGLAYSEGTSGLFFDHLLFALHAHLVDHYSTSRRGGCELRRLSLTQEKLAIEMLTADLTIDPPLAEIARALDLPLSSFGPAFRSTTGSPPFRWLRTFRVETAKRLLGGGSMPLAEIAYACGFADQSHFTRVFTKHTGVTPGYWRRMS